MLQLIKFDNQLLRLKELGANCSLGNHLCVIWNQPLTQRAGGDEGRRQITDDWQAAGLINKGTYIRDLPLDAVR